METYFYVLGIVLVLLALGVSAIGIRNDGFPSTGIMRIGVLVVALVVVATAYGAVKLSQDEKQKRLDEANIEASEEAISTTKENADIAGGGPSSATAAADDGEGAGEGPRDDASQDVATGAQVFATNGCGSCHTLADQGNEAQGTIGPNLDVELVDKDAAFIETSIVDPSAEVEEGFGDNIMPPDYGTVIEPQDLQSLVAYLQQATQPAQGGGNAKK